MRSRKKANASKNFDFRAILLIVTVFLTVCVLTVPIWFHLFSSPAAEPEDLSAAKPLETTEPSISSTEQIQPSQPEQPEPAEPTEPKVMLHDMAELYAQNPDFAAWIKVEGTDIDYPVMFTPYDEEKYIYANFQGKYDWNGLPFINDKCSFDPETKALLLYGHNKVYGGMFHDILKYEKEKFWQEHRYISFKTLYEERTYEVFGAFYDKVYLSTDDVFKYYHFIDPQTEEEYMEGIAYFREMTPYDTGIEVEYGDKLLMLITCSYKSRFGRYVVVAREVPAEEAPDLN